MVTLSRNEVVSMRGISNPTLKTVGVGTTTNYNIRSFQSDGVTEIFSLLDNGNVQFAGNIKMNGILNTTNSSGLQMGYAGVNYVVASGASGYLSLGTASNNSMLQLQTSGINANASFNLGEGVNFAAGTTTGTKIGTSTSQKIGLWNATPIVQPTTSIAAATFVANSGTAVNDASTFDGYTIKQIVKALRNIGALA